MWSINEGHWPIQNPGHRQHRNVSDAQKYTGKKIIVSAM